MNPRPPLWRALTVGSVAASACVTVTDDPATDDTAPWREVCTPESDDTDRISNACCAPWIKACKEYGETGCYWICNG